MISPKKKEGAPRPAPERKAQQRQAAAPVPTAATGPVGKNVGGFLAYGEDQVDQPPAIAKRIAPDYPARVQRLNMSGKVVVSLVVDTAGNPQACLVLAADPPGYFEEAALAAARKTRFIPGKLQGKNVNTQVALPFVFMIR